MNRQPVARPHIGCVDIQALFQSRQMRAVSAQGQHSKCLFTVYKIKNILANQFLHLIFLPFKLQVCRCGWCTPPRRFNMDRLGFSAAGFSATSPPGLSLAVRAGVLHGRNNKTSVQTIRREKVSPSFQLVKKRCFLSSDRSSLH